MLLNLVCLLQGFPLLKRIDIRPDVYNTLPFHAKGVEVNMLLSACHRWIFCSIVSELGINMTKSIFRNEHGKVMLNACDLSQGYHEDLVVARYPFAGEIFEIGAPLSKLNYIR